VSSSKKESAVLVDPDWIDAHLDDSDVRLVEVDVSPAAYKEGHIPGAVFWGAYGDFRDGRYRPIGRSEMEGLLSRSGVTREKTLVFYGYGGVLGFWLMKAFGHEDVRMLAGDRSQWPDSGRNWSTDVPGDVTGGVAYRLPAETNDLDASLEEVRAAIDDPEQMLIDVRAELEYSGERFWPSGATEDAGRAGHIPGAISIPIDLLRDESGSLRDTDELRRVFEENGVRPDKTVIVYCTIGNRASQAWFGLSYLLGYPDVRVYYASWVEWGNEADTPIETGAA
jgi:thiosulfate/3-mercaptopyruvate sulfurtransferase